MYCENCGKEIKDDAAFCPYCGTVVQKINNFNPAPNTQYVNYNNGNVKPPNGFVNWYRDHWNRFMHNNWSGMELMHHFAWLAAHIAVLLILITIIGSFSKGIGKAGNDSKLIGTWSDSSGEISITFERDGSVRVSDYTGTFGANVFKYRNVDKDTIKLKVDSSELGLLGDMLNMNVDYHIKGNTLTLEVLGEEFSLERVR